MALERSKRRHQLHRHASLMTGAKIILSANHNGITRMSFVVGGVVDALALPRFSDRVVPKSVSDVTSMWVVTEYGEYCLGEPVHARDHFPKDPLENRRNVLNYSPNLAIRSRYAKT